MFIDRLKCVTAFRASKITGINRRKISEAMDLYAATGGRIGLAFVRENKARRIRLCAIDTWLSQMERNAACERELR